MTTSVRSDIVMLIIWYLF